MTDKSYYEILGVSKNSDEKAIKDSFKKLALKEHPDRNLHRKEEATIKFQSIREAYEVLVDKKKRDIYDKYGKKGLQDKGVNFGGNMDLNDILNMFGMNQGGGHAQGAEHTNGATNIRIIEQVSLEDLYKGKDAQKEIERKTACANCNGTGSSDKIDHMCKPCGGKGRKTIIMQVGAGMVVQQQQLCQPCMGRGETNGTYDKCKKCDGEKVITEKHTIKFEIAPGMFSGSNINIKNEGNEILPREGDIKRSDIDVFVDEIQHATFRRNIQVDGKVDKADLLMEHELELHEAICGFTKKFTHLDNRIIAITHKKIIRAGDVMIIKSEGMPIKTKGKSKKKGKLYIKFSVKFPQTELTADQKGQFWQCLTKTPLPKEDKNAVGENTTYVKMTPLLNPNQDPQVQEDEHPELDPQSPDSLDPDVKEADEEDEEDEDDNDKNPFQNGFPGHGQGFPFQGFPGFPGQGFPGFPGQRGAGFQQRKSNPQRPSFSDDDDDDDDPNEEGCKTQ